MQSATACTVCNCQAESCEPCVNSDECANCLSCCCGETHLSWRRRRIHQGLLVEYVSLGWMTVEVIGSIGFGLLSGSLALIAFGSDSLVEMISGVMVITHMKSCRSSSDLGELTEKITKLLLVALIPIIAAGAVYSYIMRLRPESSPLGIGVAIGAVVIMPILWVQKKTIGRETNCTPLSIDAIESVTCFLMALTLLASLLVNYFFRISWIDYVATTVILAFVAKESIEAFRE